MLMILITDIDKFLIQTIILYMSTAFKVKDLGPRDTSWVLRLPGLPLVFIFIREHTL